MNDVVITVKNISKSYKVFNDQRFRLLNAIWPNYKSGIQEVLALTNINFEIKRGEAIGIIGRNGSGKSTLLEILTGTLTPTNGDVNVRGRVSALLELGSGFNPEYSGRDNVILNGLLLGLSKDEILNRFSEVEAFAEIGIAIDRQVKTYSTGMLVRLAFAVQVLCDPDIFIIDEALSVGDFFFQQKCFNFIREACHKGKTLIVVSHDMSAIRRICQRVIYLDQGTLIFDGEAKEAARIYLNQKYLHESPVNKKPASTCKRKQLDSPIWSNESAVAGQLYSINIKNKDGEQITFFQIGDIAYFEIEFFPHPQYPSDITVGLVDGGGRLITATGSMQLINLPEHFRSPDYIHKYQLQITLNLEAGNYGVEVSFGYRSEINEGVRLDKTPQIGPLTIGWDYKNKIAPFIGLVGLPSIGKFCKPKKNE